ncbi:MAG TPA: hypothetical protein DF712_05710 [Balneola sp.]|nr:hypothetical protein [Bacteroidota bacterium]MAC06221.1 hypothetical protein [Balneola sp.]MAO77209.1 hypothetical protein [Balneola sp.]MBF62980.1 hypothetical protein [Balneola sp.]HBZ38367.1 hypothetical protein [Balneola sp.]
MKTNYKKYLAEGTLIIFSVLFALFINKLFDDYQTNQKKVAALESIEQELLRNQSILKNWKEKHIAIRDRISSILEGESDSLKMELLKFNYLNLGILTDNESLIDAILIDTAWESARSTGIVSEFDFETTQKLTLVYSMQDVLTDRTIAKILDYYFDTNSHDMKNLERILVQFQLRFWELTGQEELMMTVYQDALEQLEE